jgi:hypothetical protein
MAAKATPKAVDALKDIPSDSTTMEKAKVLAPIYSPAAGMICLSTACIVGSNHVHKYRYAAVLALYSVGERTLQRWQESVLEEVGPKKYEKVRERSVTPDKPVPDSIILGEDSVLFYDVYSGRYFKESSVEMVRRYINDMNERMYTEDFVPINDFYYSVGLPGMQYGNEVGWSIDEGNVKVSLDAFLKDDRPCVSVSFPVRPKGDY